MKKESHLDKKSGIFQKRTNLKKSEIEIMMSHVASDLSGEKSGFYCPKLISVNHEKEILSFELLESAINLRKVFIQKARHFSSKSEQNKLKKIFYRVGKALYKVHFELKKNQNLKKKLLPEKYLQNQITDDFVFLHGDFTLNNIMYDESSDKIYFIDWSSSPFFENPFNYGPQHWDISFFISSTFYLSFSTILKNAFRHQLINAFLEGYLKEFTSGENEFLKRMRSYVLKNNYYNVYRSYWGQQKFSLRNRLFQFGSQKMLNKYMSKQYSYSSLDNKVLL